MGEEVTSWRGAKRGVGSVRSARRAARDARRLQVELVREEFRECLGDGRCFTARSDATQRLNVGILIQWHVLMTMLCYAERGPA